MADLLVHGGIGSVILLALLGIGKAIISRLDRLNNVLTDYPPHAHVPGNGIVYPTGFPPPVVQQSMARAARAGGDS